MFIVRFIKKQPAGRLIAMGFAAVILIGTLLLMLPVSVRNEGLSFVDALFTAASAVCVTGLTVVDTYDYFTLFGQIVIAVLIQIGGLGVMSIGVGLVMATGNRIGAKGRSLVKEGMNVDGFKGIVRLLKSVLIMTFCFELLGAVLSFFAFIKDYDTGRAVWLSIFHSIASFNNAGFDILGGGQSLTGYSGDIYLNLVTCGLIIFGGLGFLVILDIIKCRRFKKLSLHSKVVIVTNLALHLGGILLFKATEEISWLGAVFQSVSARTAGFATYSVSGFTSAGLFVMMFLMFIGASSGSTGGGIKTTTFFALLQEARTVVSKQRPGAFHRTLPEETIKKAGVITLVSVMMICIGTFLLSVLEPETEFVKILFEAVSAFGTVGLSTGITADLCTGSRIVIILLMYTGRIGAVTLLSMWVNRPEPSARYTEEFITIG